MDIFDNEKEIIECFQFESQHAVMLMPECDDTENVFFSIYDKDRWKHWVNTSGKNDPPPDFFSDELGLMMDVMRVDDHSFIGKKGKPINPTLARESVVAKELRESGVMEQFSNAKLYLTVDTKLPTEKDHNYSFYRDSFIRVVSAHKRKIDNYKANHPRHKTIFFVFDESSAYVQVPTKIANSQESRIMRGEPHLWFLDKSFVEILKGSEIDYLIWYTPYKLITTIDHGIINLPRVVVIKVDALSKAQLEYYNENKMMSSER